MTRYPPDDGFWQRRLRDIQRSYTPRYSPPAPKPKPWRVTIEDVYRKVNCQTFDYDTEMDAYCMALSFVWNLIDDGYDWDTSTGSATNGNWLLSGDDGEARIVRVERVQS